MWCQQGSMSKASRPISRCEPFGEGDSHQGRDDRRRHWGGRIILTIAQEFQRK